MTAEEYIVEACKADRLTFTDLANFVRFFQARMGENVDGKPGPSTMQQLAVVFQPQLSKPEDVAPFLSCPLPFLPASAGHPQARKPVITSSFRPANRLDHDGLDLFYRWVPGDKPDFVGDGGCEGKLSDGNPKWVVPYGTSALAAADGVIQLSGPSPTGYRIWINHGNGLRSGYFHLSRTYFDAGVKVKKGTAIGIVGHNPDGKVDGNHLHFEVSPVEKYQPLDPHKYLLFW